MDVKWILILILINLKKKNSTIWFLTNFGSLNPNLHRNFFSWPSGGSEMGPEHGPTNWNLWKIELVSLCGFSRVWWKMKNCILSLALSGQVFWLPKFLIFWLWLLAWTGWGIFVKYVSKNLKINNLSKTSSFVEIF